MTNYTLDEAKLILEMLVGRESGFTTTTQVRDAARVVLDHLAEEPEGVVEYRVLDAEGEFWAGADRLAEALHYLALEPGGRIERAVWVPVKQEGSEQ